MTFFAKILVLACLWGLASYAQAQAPVGRIKVETCKTAAAKARSLIAGFYKSNKTDFPDFIEEQKQKTRDFGRDARTVAGTGMGIKGFLATAGAGKLLDMRFEKAVRILIENKRYQTKDVFRSYVKGSPKRQHTPFDAGTLDQMQGQFVAYCIRAM